MAPQTPQARAAASKVAYYKLRQRLYDLKGNRCRDCSATEKLEAHHVHTDGKNRERCNGRYKEYRRLLKNPKEYALLCGRCHQAETMRWVRSFRHTNSHTSNEKGALLESA
jgi:hypothetical protein